MLYVCIFIMTFFTKSFNYCPCKNNSVLQPQDFRRVTRNFQDRGIFLEMGHFDKHSPKTRERKAPQVKNLRLFRWETLENFILNEKFYPQMTTIRAFFLQIRTFFSNFLKRAGETSPSPPLQLSACIVNAVFYMEVFYPGSS